MAVLLVEGWDHVNTAAQAQEKGWMYLRTPTDNGGIAWAGGRFGGYCIRHPAFNRYGPDEFALYKDHTAASTIIVGMAAYIATMAYTGVFLKLETSAGVAVAKLSWDYVSHYLTVLDSTGATILSPRNAARITPNTWHYYELKVVKGATGTVELRVDGVSVAGPTTGNFGTTDISRLNLVCSATEDYQGNVYFDDVYVADTTGAAPRNDFLGDIKVETIIPTADGATSAWTPNSGAVHYDRVNQTYPDDDTTYVKSSTVGNVDTYGTGNLTPATGTIYAVQTVMRARKDDSNLRQIAPVIRQGGTDYVGATKALASSYVYFTEIYQQDPVSADWTITNVNADEFGAKVVG